MDKAYCAFLKTMLSNRQYFSQGVRSMRKESTEFVAQYRPMPYERRFWVGQEECYTQEELQFRGKILEFRKKSKLSDGLLSNPSSFFSEKENALVNVNDKAYFLPNAYKPEHSLSPEDFQVQPIDEQRLQWPLIDNLMQETGDYLLLRNQNLPQEHLNQPMNYVLLDINYMLRDLSQNPNIKQVMEQLEYLTAYIRNIERHSPKTGSDKLFLANFRFNVDKKIQPHLAYQMESKLLKDKLQEMSKTTRKLSTERNRILHFALSTNPVNPHSYDFTMEAIEDTKAYPSQAAKQCSLSPRVLATEVFSGSELKDCPNFSLINADDEVLSQYAKAIIDLNELAKIQKIIANLTHLLGRAGEHHTIQQFKNQILDLLKQINSFLDDSSQPIESLIEANTQAYHWAIQKEQNLGRLERFTSEPLRLKTYIKNQDTLAQYPSSISDLSKTTKLIKEQIAEATRHLSKQPPQIEINTVSAFFPQKANLYIPPTSSTLPLCQDSDPNCQTKPQSPNNTNNAILGIGFIFSLGLALLAFYLIIKWMQQEGLEEEESHEERSRPWPNISF